MFIRNHVIEMVCWGCAAAVVGLGINLIHPHRIPYVKTPPPPVVTTDDPKEAPPKVQEIDVATAKDLWDLGEYLFVDSRTAVQFSRGHIAKSVDLPWDEYDKYFPALRKTLKSKPGIIVYCAGEECDLSHALARQLYKEGFKDIFVFFGGWEEWQRAGYPEEAGR
jgi:rhodanese-related sulfurtransferase